MTENSSIPASVEKLSIVDKYFSLKKEGRINRMQFFVRNITGILVWLLLMFCIFVLIQINIFVIDKGNLNRSVFGIIFAFIPIVTIIPPLYVFFINTCKRAHDLNHSGAWYFLGYIFGGFGIGLMITLTTTIVLIMVGNGSLIGPFAGTIGKISVYLIPLIILVILQFRRGTPHKNKYGPAPTGEPLV